MGSKILHSNGYYDCSYFWFKEHSLGKSAPESFMHTHRGLIVNSDTSQTVLVFL